MTSPVLDCKLAFIGGGNMAQALMHGLKQRGFAMSNIMVIEPDNEKRASLTSSLGVTTSDTIHSVTNCDTIILAVKPQQLKAVAQSLAPLLTQQLVISVAAGVRTTDLSAWLNQYRNLIRCMPNTPAQIQAGITGIYALPEVSQTQQTLAAQLLQSAGEVVWLEDEQQLDAVTAISGSGPAYVFLMIEGLIEAGIALGLSPMQAQQLSLATFKGASLLASSSATPVPTLREQVTSKGGTTEQGLISLNQDQLKPAIVRAAQRAAERANTLGNELGAQ